MDARELGGKVLTTIQNLISQIDKSAQLSSARKPNKRSEGYIQQEQFDKYKVYSKMSYNYRKDQLKSGDILRKEAYEREKQYQKFKITNRTTLKILNSRNIKPIHQRTREIIAKKDNFVRYQQMHRQLVQKQTRKPLHRSIDDLIERKYNESELQEYRMQIDAKNKQRIKKKNMNKLSFVKKQEVKIPVVNEVSRSLSSRRNLRKNYSDNVFKRLIQYGYQQKTRHIQLMQTRRKQQGNFQPVICQKSIEIAQNLKKKQKKLQHSLHHQSHCLLQKELPKNVKKSKNHCEKSKSNSKSVERLHSKSARADSKRQKSVKNPINFSKGNTPLKQKSQNSTNAKSKSKEKPYKQTKQQSKIKKSQTSKTKR